MTFSSQTKDKIYIVTGIFVLALVMASCYYPWQSMATCLLLLLAIAWLLAKCGSQRH